MFSDVIAAMRSRRGLLIKEFGTLLGISPSYASRLEGESRKPSLLIVNRLLSIAEEDEKLLILSASGMIEMDELAIAVQGALGKDSTWSVQRREAFRKSVRAMLHSSSA